MPSFKVPDMHGNGGVTAVTKAARARTPAALVTGDLETLKVDIGSRQPASALAAAIADAGFSVDQAA